MKHPVYIFILNLNTYLLLFYILQELFLFPKHINWGYISNGLLLIN